MRLLISAIAAMIVLSGALRAQDVQPANPGIEQVIRDQTRAFQADDFVAAFDFAGPGIRSMFRTPENFGAMVRNGYPMVWRPESLRFGDLREIGGALWQKVIVQDDQGRTHVLDYRMGQYDGGWRIDGVQLLEAPGLAA
ncbi:DUF4864 domain-containing protein [Tropicibacter oceani]|uniref:DUF4864 domain-containing protein n=1 Tax=Tropicibacter oceani TaxID=3058420 RepID=A0ABY8QJC0_9RHOB|nr:DUF4864 domain-containing protein [Tropicibacter oceani]WGW04088.1 DUF4864 domain-containing protein [Tropicibacter oceani]